MDFTFFNPLSQSEPDFLAGFVARSEELDYYLRQLRILSGSEPARHHLIVAPRGFGKTSLLRRLAIAVRVEDDLAARFIPLTFREEQHNVISLDVFWRNCLQSLLEAREDEHASEAELEVLDAAWAAHAPRQALNRDDQDGDPAWREFQSRCHRLGRRPLLLMDNLDTLLAGLTAKHQWSLRGILQQADGPVLIAAAPAFPEATHDPAAPFYDFFRVETLDKLSDPEVMRCLRTMATHRGASGRVVLDLLDKDPGRIAALNTLAGGNPRTLSVLYSVLESHMSTDVLSQLSAMLDTFTSWYQSRAEALPAQARAVFDALALNWDPMTAAAVGTVTGLDTTVVSSQISRLEKAGLVEAVALQRRGTGRSGYQLGERFFNIWYLMRNGPRRTRQSVKFLTVFLQSCFSVAERRTLARTAMTDGSANPAYALGLAASLSASPLREQLLDYAATRSTLAGTAAEYGAAIEDLRQARRRRRGREPQEDSQRELAKLDRAIARFGRGTTVEARRKVAEALADKATMLYRLGRLDETVGAWNDLVARFADASEPALRERVARALFNKGVRLGQLGQHEQAIEVYESVVARFGDASGHALRELVARALVSKGVRLSRLGQHEQAIEVYESVVARFSDASEPALRELVAKALLSKGVSLGELGQDEQAIEVYESVVARFADTSEPALRELVAMALLNKGVSLGQLGQDEQAIEVYESVVARFADASEPALREPVAKALVNEGVRLGQLGQHEQAIEVYESVAARFADASESALREQGSLALFNKGVSLGELGQHEQAIEVYESVVARFADASEPALREQVAMALVNKGVRLDELGQHEQAIEVYESVVARFADASEPALREQVAMALFNKGASLGELGQHEQAIEVYESVVARFADASEPALREPVARALLSKGASLGELGQHEQAIEVYESVVARFADASEPALREPVARALLSKGASLGELGQHEQAIEVYESVVARFADASEPALRELAGEASIVLGTRLSEAGSMERAEAVLRTAAAVTASRWSGVAWNALGNLLLDHLGNPAKALEAFESGLLIDPVSENSMFLHANCAYALALHRADLQQAQDHARHALADGKSISSAGRHLLGALACLQEPSTTRWPRFFEQVGLAVASGDPNLWSAYLDDLQRLIWFVVAEGEGPSLREWMDRAQYPLHYAPLYQAVVAAIDGEDSLLKVNPETRSAATRIFAGIARRLNLYGAKAGPARRRK